MRAILIPFALLAIVIESMLLVMRELGDLRHHIVATIALLIGTSVPYLVAVFLALRIKQQVPLATSLFIVTCAIIFRLTPWPIYPAFSGDVSRYRWEGKLQAAGGNPYQSRPADPEWTSLRDSTYANIAGKDFKAGYGPLTELIEAAEYRIIARTVPDPDRQAFWFKLPAALLDLGISWAVCKLVLVRGLPVVHALVYLWSPLPVFEFWGSGHNDGLMLLALLVAVIAAIRDRWMIAFACLGIATAAKLWPAILLPLFVSRALMTARIGWRRLAANLAIFAGISLLSFLPYRSNIIENLQFMSGFIGGWRNNDLLFGFILRAAG